MTPEQEGPVRVPFAKKAAQVLWAEVSRFRPGLFALELVDRVLPAGRCGGLRAGLLRLVGIEVGRGTQVLGAPRITGDARGIYGNLAFGAGCHIGPACAIEAGDRVGIEDGVTLGAEVLILTTSHEIGPREHRCGALTRKPVRIGARATIGARSVILPGVTIGEGAIVSEASVVAQDVKPGVRVAGVPARAMKAPVRPD